MQFILQVNLQDDMMYQLYLCLYDELLNVFFQQFYFLYHTTAIVCNFIVLLCFETLHFFRSETHFKHCE